LPIRGKPATTPIFIRDAPFSFAGHHVYNNDMTIQVLAPDVADKIAAGEVVEGHTP